MDWAMRDEHFKIQLFRFIDVLPSLSSSADIARHLEEYLGEGQVHLSPALRLAVKASTSASWLFGAGVKQQVMSLARQFMLGNEDREITSTLRHLHDRGIRFTIDVLGETVVSEAEADDYAARYLALMDLLARESANWPRSEERDVGPHGPIPLLNVSVKISALYSQIQPTDPETALAHIGARLRPILRRAAAVGAFVNFDMEQYALKDLTLSLFKALLSEAEFGSQPACGLALQAYLQESEGDLSDLIAWARRRRRRITVRLVKGAYWDYESIHAEQKGWPVPVFLRKSESDLNFEKLSRMLLENSEVTEPAFGTHNVRSVAHALAQAEHLQRHPHSYEFQMLHGMADSLKDALVQLGFRVREYCPVGELLPGMAYLVRRLLENTSNEGFLARSATQSTNREQLLANPAESLASTTEPHVTTAKPRAFRNEPSTDFTRAAERERIRAGLQKARRSLSKHHPLVINNKAVQTVDWLPSLNPGNQQEVIGYAAQATISDAEAALAAAGAAKTKWARTSCAERAALLERLADLMQRNKVDLCALEILEAGKNWTEADADVAEAIDFCRFYAVGMRSLGARQCTQPVPAESNFEEWWPRGIGLVIAPWNFPLAILTGMTTAAIVTGNSVIVKPSDQTPIIAAFLMRLLQEAGLPPGVGNLLTGPGSTVGAHLVTSPQVDFIAFTGSKEVGLSIWQAAGQTPPAQSSLKKVVCEMGGKNAIIVDDDADLDEAVLGVISSAFGYQGQKCSALSRLIVLAGAYDRFLERLIAAASSLRVGPAEEPGNVIGPVISREAQNRILSVIEAGKKEATLAWQGKVPQEPNACYVPPTIFTNVPVEGRLFKEEIFGPVLSVTRASDFESALALANASEFALTGGIYSRSPANVERAKAEFICGNLYINRTITGAIVERQPFGGFKMSGGGTKAGGLEYLKNFMVPRVVTENCLRRGFAPTDLAD
jgi:RHH-type proline utilization regulon transcriptional repressor/proline dehydrogenase/delta 1-pyrroline-5-carboxylate dehydrogenase